jgi:hypothetical protein
VRFSDGVKKAWPILREAAKYAPAAKTAFEAVKEPVSGVVNGRRDRMLARRDAYREAATVVDGAVLLILTRGQPRWVVYSGDRAISVHPSTEADDLERLTQYADLSKRETPEQRRERLLQARIRRAAARRTKGGGRRRQVGSPDEPSP